MSLSAYWTTWAAISGGLLVLSEKLDEILSDHGRKRASILLTSGGSAEGWGWPELFLLSFTRLFGEKHLTWKCFFRSSMASILGVFLVLALWGSLSDSDLFDLPPGQLLKVLFGVFTISCIINLIPDFLALLETRFMIIWISSSRKIVSIMLCDLVATWLIAWLVIIPFQIVLQEGIFTLWLDVLKVTDHDHGLQFVAGPSQKPMSVGLFDPQGGGVIARIPFGIWYYSAFLSSVWIWLLALSIPLVRATLRFRRLNSYLTRIFAIDRKPILVLGVTSVLIVTAIFLIVSPLYIHLE